MDRKGRYSDQKKEENQPLLESSDGDYNTLEDSSRAGGAQGTSVGDQNKEGNTGPILKHLSGAEPSFTSVDRVALTRKWHSNASLDEKSDGADPDHLRSPRLAPTGTSAITSPVRAESPAQFDYFDVENGLEVVDNLGTAKDGQARAKLHQEFKAEYLHKLGSRLNGTPGQKKSAVSSKGPKYLHFESVSQKVTTLYTLHEVFNLTWEEHLQKRHYFWLDICYPSKDDMNFCERVLSLHPLSTEDILLNEKREKMEVFDNYLLISIQVSNLRTGFHFEEGAEESENWFIAVYPHYVLSFHARPFELISNVVRRCRASANPRPDWIMYHMLDVVCEAYQRNVDIAEADVESLHEITMFVGDREQNDVMLRIGQSHRRLLTLMKNIKPKKDILGNIINRKTILINKKTYLYVRDIVDDVLGMLQTLDFSREVLNQAQSSYLATVSINVSKSSNDLNEVLNKLTVATTIFLPLTFITSMWGMNVRVPGQVGVEEPEPGQETLADTLIPFWLLNLFMLLLCILMGLWAKYMKLI